MIPVRVRRETGHHRLAQFPEVPQGRAWLLPEETQISVVADC